jgi:Fur family transcriptional regulator, peroxide stress response regulator
MNYRKSQQRERILQILKETDSHPTADWVYARLKEEIPGLSLGTVYRNLKVLIEQGHIQKLPFGSTFDRFDAELKPHYHLVCEKCGMVSDFEMPQNSHLNELAQQISRFKVNRHRIDFFGICEKCQNN